MVSWLIALIFVALIVYNVYAEYVRDDRVRARLLRRTPAVPIADAAWGVPVKIVGTVRQGDHALTSPLRQERCVFSRTDVRVPRPTMKGPPHWTLILREEKSVAFLVEDETGSVRIESESVALVDWASSPLPEAAAGRCEKLRLRHEDFRHKGPSHWWTPDRPYRFGEDVIAAGARVAVYGMIREGEPRTLAAATPLDQIAGKVLVSPERRDP